MYELRHYIRTMGKESAAGTLIELELPQYFTLQDAALNVVNKLGAFRLIFADPKVVVYWSLGSDELFIVIAF